MGFIADFKAGRALTKMIDIVEEAARYKKSVQEGCALRATEHMESLIERDLMKNLEPLRKFPRHIVTENLLKIVHIAKRFGDNARIESATQVLDLLVEEGVALDLNTFEKSFVR